MMTSRRQSAPNVTHGVTLSRDEGPFDGGYAARGFQEIRSEGEVRMARMEAVRPAVTRRYLGSAASAAWRVRSGKLSPAEGTDVD